MKLISLLAFLFTAGLLPAYAAEQQPGPAPEEAQYPPVAPDVQDLYQNALQSIADGRKLDAQEALRKVIDREAQHAGAYLDLGLIQCSLGYTAEAERLFSHIINHFDPPDGIRELIQEARQTGCASWEALSQGTLTVSRGVAKNINQGSYATGLDVGLPVELPLSDEFKPIGDQYSQVTADYSRDLNANGTLGFAQLQVRHYDRHTQYDSSSLFVGAESPWRFGRWTLRGSVLLGLITLDGRLYQEQAQIQARIETPWKLPYGVRFNITPSMTRQHFRTLNNFDANTAELRGSFVYRDNGNYVTLGGSYMDDRASDGRPGGNRGGWLSNVFWRHALAYNVLSEMSYSRQSWDGDQDYLPGLIDVRRRQVTHSWRASLNYPLTKNQSLVLEGRIIRNKENISIFKYNDRQLQLSWQWQRP